MGATLHPPRSRLSQATKANVWDKSGSVCYYCGVPLHPIRTFTIDHVVPVVRGGTNDLGNLVASCRSCNTSKRDRDAPHSAVLLLDDPRRLLPPRPTLNDLYRSRTGHARSTNAGRAGSCATLNGSATASGEPTPAAESKTTATEDRMSFLPPRDTASGRMLTVPEVVGQLGMSEETVWRWIRSGQLSAIRLGGVAGYRIRETALEGFLATRQTSTTLARQLLDAALAPAPARTVEELERENAELRRRLDEVEIRLAAASDRR
jgi:excisionase family DNA binding protein